MPQIYQFPQQRLKGKRLYFPLLSLPLSLPTSVATATRGEVLLQPAATKGPNIYEHKEEIVLPRHNQKGEDKCLYFPRPQQVAWQRGSQRRNWKRLQLLQDKLLYRVRQLLQAISASFFISILSPSFWGVFGVCVCVCACAFLSFVL